MDKKTVFVKTSAGESEVNGQSDALYGDAKRILLLVDDESTVGEISKRAPPSLRETLDNVLQELADGGYIRDMRAPVKVPLKPTLKITAPVIKMAVPKVASPPQNIPPAAKQVMSAPETKVDEPVKFDNADLDFSFITSGVDKSKDQAAPEKAKAEAMTRQDAERLKAEQLAQIEAVASAAKQKAYEAAKAKENIGAATKARIEAETRARIEAEVKIKQEVEAARLRAEKEAEKIRLELAVAKAKAEEEMRNRLEAEARAKIEEESRKKREAAAERLKIEKELAELEVARIKAEADLKMRAEAEIRIRAEMDASLKAKEFAKYGDLHSASQGESNQTEGSQILAEEEHIDHSEKLRQSFVEAFGKDKGKKKSDSLNFKLDTFSFVNTETVPAATLKPQNQAAPAGDDAKAREQKAQKEAEAQRIKAGEEAARLKIEQQKADRIKAEQVSIRLKAEHEAYRLKVAQEEERVKVEAEAQKLADQQAKQWEEAQQRAAIQAQAEKERLAKQSAEAQKKAQQKPPRPPRKPLPLGKIVAGLLALVLFAVAGLPYIWPLGEYIAPLEREISTQLNQPVQIKKISLAFLPLPRLELHNLAVGGGQELEVDNAVLNFDFSALFSPTRSINSIALNNVNISGPSLDKALVWLQAAGGNEKYPVARIELKGVRVKNDDIKIPLFDGSAKFDAQGKFTKADLKSVDDKFSIELQSLQNRLQLELSVHESSLPVLTKYKFNDLSVSGTIVNDEFIFSDFFAHIHGGTLTGKGKLGWFNGWKLEGLLNAKSLELQSLFPNFGVTGEVYGDVNVSMYGAGLSLLDKDPRMGGTFETKNGTVNKLDIESIARFGSRQGSGGRTNFNELTGSLSADNRVQRFNLNKISAGAVSGSGFFEVDADQQLSGKLMVDIGGLDRGKIPLLLSGSPAVPQLQAVR